MQVTETGIQGLRIIHLDVREDERGWFKENWNEKAFSDLGFKNFVPVQNNMSFNHSAGVTRGIHAEPWDKLVSVASGKVFGAWVDLREGPDFGQSFWCEIDPTLAVFVPRGVANAFQVLEDETTYSYLVTSHWSEGATYNLVNLADRRAGIPWPIPLEKAIISDKDREHPPLSSVVPMKTWKTVVFGASGQLGRALMGALPDAIAVDRGKFRLGEDVVETLLDWSEVSTVINAAAYTAVDNAETDAGRVEAWSTNVFGLAKLAQFCTKRGITLVHVSSDYVFDGLLKGEYSEQDLPSPKSTYGATKSAGDAIVGTVPSHYIVRTSWVIGDGRNFVRTMCDKALQDADVRVVDDQFGRLTFTEDLAQGICYLLATDAEFGIYNLSASGPVATWHEIAQHIYRELGKPIEKVTAISTAEFEEMGASQSRIVAPRPANSALSLTKIKGIGFSTLDWRAALKNYILAYESSRIESEQA